MKRDNSTFPSVYTYNMIIQCIYLTRTPEWPECIPFQVNGINGCNDSTHGNYGGTDGIHGEFERRKAFSKTREDMSGVKLEFISAKLLGYLKVLDEMKGTGLKKSQPNVYTYNLILKGFCSIALESSWPEHECIVQNCIGVYSEMKRNKYTQPDIVTFSTIMRTLYFVVIKSECSKTIDLIIELYRHCKISLLPNKVVNSIVLNVLSLRIIRGDYDSASIVSCISEAVILGGSGGQYLLSFIEWYNLLELQQKN